MIIGDTARLVTSLAIDSTHILTAPVTVGDGCLLGANISGAGVNTVWRVRSEADASVLIGPGQGLRAAGDVDVSPDGDLFVMNRAIPRDIFRYPGATAPGVRFQPVANDGAIVAASQDVVYFGQYSGNTIQRLLSYGTIETIGTIPAPGQVRRLALDGSGTLYVQSTGGVYRFDFIKISA